jgi:Ca2+-transporting ATPase
MRNKEYRGLTEKEVLEAREKYGTNEMEKKKKENFLQKVVHIFSEPMFLLLIITASIYFILGEIGDGVIMLCFVLFISGIEFVQEQKTDKAIEELNVLSSLNVKVIREGKTKIIDSKDIVVGDIVKLEEGDKISADSVILECQGLGVNESALTGESEVVYKKLEDNSDNHFKLNKCYAGCDVVNGSATVRVTEVGINTEYGKIGRDLNTISKEKTPLEKQVKKLIVVCTLVSFLFFVGVIIINFICSKNLIFKDRLIQSILSGITIAMATIPEEIPVVLTVFLAMGAWGLTQKNTLTRNMKAVETLGAVTVLCTDKTGTLTENKMTVKKTFSSDEDFLLVSSLACPKVPYDTMEIAIQEYCFKDDINNEVYDNDLIYEYVFNNEDKMMGQIWRVNDKNLLCVKGAYESVLELCEMNKDNREKVVKKVEEYSRDGYRVLAIAKREDVVEIPKRLKDNKLVFVGLIALEDPPREGVKDSIKSCYEAGVRVIMITGDNGETAKGIAGKIGLEHNDKVITGRELEEISDDELKEVVKTTNIFARVYPNHKMRIVKALQENNEVVAMTGDGVNDAPALKKAEIGIAMGKRGTNVSKESSDMILMDDNFNTIVVAIKNGRTIYNNIRKAISYILVIHIPIALVSLIVPLFKLPTLLLPIHIVLLELIIDPTSSIIFQRLKPDGDVMREKPRRIDEAIMSGKEVIKCILQGLVIFLFFFGSYYCLIRSGCNQSFARTFSFAILVLSNILVVYVLQSKEYALKNFVSDLKDRVIVMINSLIIIMLLFIIYVPVFNKLVGTSGLEVGSLLMVVLISLLATIPFDILKVFGKNK